MEFVQCWIGKKPNNKILNCIDSVISHIRSEDKYSMISSIDFLKDSSVNWIPYEDYVNELKKDDALRRFFEIVENIKYKAILSDVIRFDYMSKNSDVFYVDTDVNLKNIPEFEDFVYAPHKGNVLIDYFIFYNGTNTSIPKRILDISLQLFLERREAKIELNHKELRSWMFDVLNMPNIRNNIKKIDNSCFSHLSFGGYE